jgi:hypothetical protein
MLTAAWARTGASTLWDRSRSHANTAPAPVVDSIAASTASRCPLPTSATSVLAGLPW